MSNKYKFHDQDKLYFISFAVVNWMELLFLRRHEPLRVGGPSFSRLSGDFYKKTGAKYGDVAKAFFIQHPFLKLK